MKVRKYPYRIELYDGLRLAESFRIYAKNGVNAARALRNIITIRKDITLRISKMSRKRN